MSTQGKVITCKAAVAWGAGEPLVIEDVQVEPPKAHEVRIKMLYSGLCHTELTFLYGTGKGASRRPFPIIMGHEGAGVVESVGPGVTSVSPGDQVIPVVLPQCRECERCKSPKTNQCRKNWKNSRAGVMADGTSRVTWNDQQIRQYAGVSTLSQFTVVGDICVAKIRPDAPLDRVFLLGCGVSTGYGSACRTAQVEKGSSCAVFGLGAVGLAAVMGCQASGASRIIAVDINPKKFKLAKELGATECINPLDHKPQRIQDVLKEKTQGGVDYALECVGNPTVTAEALESTVDAWGVCVAVGWTDTGPISVDVDELLMGRTLKGAYFGGYKGPDDFPVLVDKYMKKELKLDEFITHRLSLSEVNKALELLKNGDSVRTAVSLW